MTAELSPPPGWTVVLEQRGTSALEDAASAFTDGAQWTVRDPTGQLPAQSAWPSAWREQAVRYAWQQATAREGDLLRLLGLAGWPSYRPSPSNEAMLPTAPRSQSTGALHDRPGLFLRRWQRDGEQVHPVEAPWSPTEVRIIAPGHLPESWHHLPGGLGLVLGISARRPSGQLGQGWLWFATRSVAQVRKAALTPRPARWVTVESICLRLRHPASRRAAAVLWTLDLTEVVIAWAGRWVAVATAVTFGSLWLTWIRILPKIPNWSSEFAIYREPGAMERSISVAALKAAIRS